MSSLRTDKLIIIIDASTSICSKQGHCCLSLFQSHINMRNSFFLVFLRTIKFFFSLSLSLAAGDRMNTIAIDVMDSNRPRQYEKTTLITFSSTLAKEKKTHLLIRLNMQFWCICMFFSSSLLLIDVNVIFISKTH